MTVAASTTFTYTGRANTLDWSKYGLQIHFQDDGLPVGATECKLSVRASLSGDFHFPEETELVSGIYAVSASCKFCKPVTVELQHCAVLEQEEDSSDMAFVTSSCLQKNLPYNFMILDGGEFPRGRRWGKMQLSHFSLVGAIRRKRPHSRPGKEYCGRLYYLATTRHHCWRIHYVIVGNLKLHITVRLP